LLDVLPSPAGEWEACAKGGLTWGWARLRGVSVIDVCVLVPSQSPHLVVSSQQQTHTPLLHSCSRQNWSNYASSVVNVLSVFPAPFLGCRCNIPHF